MFFEHSFYFLFFLETLFYGFAMLSECSLNIFKQIVMFKKTLDESLENLARMPKF